MKKRVLFLMSDTGGGHRATAEAVRDAMYAKYGDQVEAKLVDVFRASQFPMNYMPEFYPWIVNHSPSSWGMGYKLSNSKRRAAVLSRTMYLANAKRFRRMLDENPADVVVSVHSVITRPVMRTLMMQEERPPFVTIVTDLVTTHMFWYDRRSEITLVPTQAAFDRGIEAGLKPDKMRITGLPVHPKFTKALVGQAEARQKLGWDADLPTILMVAGGDGMGPLFKTARAIDAKRMKCQLVIVAGRNESLKKRLEAQTWAQPTHIYPFVTNMPELMDAADMIVTKAGPSTITEAAIAGLPMIISDAIPGQEDGNVTYVVENNAGTYTPDPDDVADVVEGWLAQGTDGLRRLSSNARSIANPDAVWEIADEIWEWAQHGKIKNPRKSLWEQTREIVPMI